MQPSHQIFDRALYRQRRERFSPRFHQHDFLYHAAEERLSERLDAMKRHFEHTVIFGAAGNVLMHHKHLKNIIYANDVVSRLPCIVNNTISNGANSVFFQCDADVYNRDVSEMHHMGNDEGLLHRTDSKANVPSWQQRASYNTCMMDEEWFPFQDDSLDAIISVLHMHHVNDVTGMLIQMRRALKPDGLLLIATYGARTLQELRQAYAEAETVLYGGISPRISPFLEVRDAGGLLQRSGFALPVADSEMLTISYPSLHALHQELRGMGERNILHERIRTPLTRTLLASVEAAYRAAHEDAEGRLSCSVEMVCMTGWKPHASQQQPLKRGSATINLNNIFS
jgi:NADH dehydrogenase [ubiquinone] 1 alpha subcomplex assembly factor 5